jgi:hypothetical protein
MTTWNPGLKSVGGVPLRTTECATLDASVFGNDATDAANAIQKAIDDCPIGQVVRLPAGTYRISAAVVITKGIVLRGDGPDKTKLIRTNVPENNSAPVLMIGVGGGNVQNDISVPVIDGLDKGSTRIVVSEASKFQDDELALLDELDDPTTVTTGNCSWYKRNDGGLRSVSQLVEIKKVSGTTLELSSPLHLAFSALMKPKLTKLSTWYGPANANLGPVRYAGIENLHVTGGSGSNITVGYAAYSWLKNIESSMVAGRSVMMQGCYRCELRDSYIHHAKAYNTGGGSYGVSLIQSSDSLIENNVVFGFNQVIVLENSAGGNVVAYNYADDAYNSEAPAWQMPDITSHCSWPHMELIEGNYVAHLVLDGVHGGAGNITFYRNYSSARHRDVVDGDSFRDAVQVSGGNVNVNVIGNVLFNADMADKAAYEVSTNDECTHNNSAVFRMGGWFNGGGACTMDANVKATIVRHGNFDFVSKSVIWSDSIANRDLPASLYLEKAPAFFKDGCLWPFVDPTRPIRVGILPAKARFDAMQPVPSAPFKK